MTIFILLLFIIAMGAHAVAFSSFKLLTFLFFMLFYERDPGLGVVLAELALKGEHRGILDHMFIYLNV